MSASRDLEDPRLEAALARRADPTAGASIGQRVFLGLGLLLFVILCALPVAAFVWIAGALFASFGAAELLERTRGLAPDTYAAAFRLVLLYTVVMAVVELKRIFGGPPPGRGLVVRSLTRPAILGLLLFVPALFLARVDIRGTDVPDLLTALLLLACLAYIYVILPLALLVFVARLARWAWRCGRRSGFASGVLGTLGLAFASCVPLVCARDDEPIDTKKNTWQLALERGLKAAEGKDLEPASRAFLGELVLRPWRTDLLDFEHGPGLLLGEPPSDLPAAAMRVGVPPGRPTAQLRQRADPLATQTFA